MSRIYPIHTLADARAYEAAVLGGDTELTRVAMQNAGRAIGQAILVDYREYREWPEQPAILVLAGKGLNTGDAFIACEELFKTMPGMRVRVVESAAAGQMHALAAEALERLTSTMGTQLERTGVGEFVAAGSTHIDVVIDGVFGHGFRPPLPEPLARLLDHINQRNDIGMRVSVDLPSGMGESTDPHTFSADFTYIPGVAKEPCFDDANLAKVGRIRFLEIEPFLNQPVDAARGGLLVSPSAYKTRNRLRRAQSDKRDYRHCLILAGSSHMPGAALMSAMGALQAGAGLVTTFAPASVAVPIASEVPESMWRPLPVNPDGGLEVESVRQVSLVAAKAHALLIGPGLLMDRSTVFTLCRIIREVHLPLVLDASALVRDVISAVLGRPHTAGPVVITPHAGEFARLHGQLPENARELRDALLGFSTKYRVITVLKGSPTRICDGRRIVFAPVGGPVLARGGTGDILAGMLTTLLAQTPEDPVRAALDAVTWHGAAGDSLARQNGTIAVRSTDLLPHLASTLRA